MIDVTCAIIRNDENEILVVQRGEKSDHPFKWEFPGGKTKPGETHEECIAREIAEELSIDIVICGMLEPVEYDYGSKHINLIPFVCDTLDELPVLSEHVAFKWINAEELPEVDFSEADIIVAGKYITTLLKDVREINSNEAIHENISDETDIKGVINGIMSMQEADWMAVSASENPDIFNKLLQYSYSDEKKLAFRASWILSKVCDRHPEMIYPYISTMTEALGKIDNESVERSFLRILAFTDIERLSQKHHGLLAEHCFASLSSASSAIAIKAYAMEVLYKLSILYPDLGNELATSIRLLMEDGSAGIKARGIMILKRISEIPLDH